MKFVKESIPAYFSEMNKTIGFQYEQYRTQDCYYLNDEIREASELKALLESKYPQETAEGLKFLLGVVPGHPGAR